jgi:hypothetical protein
MHHFGTTQVGFYHVKVSIGHVYTSPPSCLDRASTPEPQLRLMLRIIPQITKHVPFEIRRNLRNSSSVKLEVSPDAELT